jgi:hypothetical protein
VTVPGIVPPTSLVLTVNVALVAPAGTVTVSGTVSGSLEVIATAAPPTGAEAVRPTVPVTGSPPTTVDALKEIVETATRATVSDDDWLLVPFSDAVTLAVPAVTPVMVKVAVVDPTGMVTADCTVATAGLLLVNVTLAATVGAALTDTVPCATLPIPIVGALSVTPDIAGPVVVGEDGELEPPHLATDRAANKIKEKARNGERLRSFIIQCRAARTGPLPEQWLRQLCAYYAAWSLRLQHPFDDDDRSAVEAQRSVVPPGAQLRAQCLQRLAFARLDRRIVEAVDDGQFQVGHASTGVEREECAIAVQGHDVDVPQMVDHGTVHDDQRTPIRNRHELDIRLGVGLDRRPRRRLLEQCDDRPADVGVDLPKPAYDIVWQRQRDDLTRSSKFRWPAASGLGQVIGSRVAAVRSGRRCRCRHGSR